MEARAVAAAEHGSPRAAKRCLITGGLGYAGAWMTSALAAAGHTAFVLSRRAGATVLRAAAPLRGDLPADAAPPYTPVQADLARQSPAELAALLPEGLEAVVHAASCNDGFVPDYGQKALTVNALGTRNLLEALLLQSGRCGRPLPLFLYVSTVHVYGASHGRITETSPCRPLNDYALTHLFGEEYGRMFMRAHGLPLTVIRLSNGYGAPRTADSDKWHLLLNDLCAGAFSRGRVALRSPPDIRRDFVWLGDIARAVEALVGRPDLAGRVFNLSSGVSLSLGEVAGRVRAGAARFLQRDVPLALERPPGATSAPGLHVDNAAVRAALNIDFHDRMEEEIAALFSLLAARRSADLA
jgi:UDP-glucose 4-epimerase